MDWYFLILRNVRSCGCLKMIFGIRPLGHRPRLCSFVTSIVSFLFQYDCQEVCAPSQSQVNVGTSARLSSQDGVSQQQCSPQAHFRSLTVSLRFPLSGMRALPVRLMFLSSPGSPNRYSATGSPSGTSNLCLRVRVALNS